MAGAPPSPDPPDKAGTPSGSGEHWARSPRDAEAVRPLPAGAVLPGSITLPHGEGQPGPHPDAPEKRRGPARGEAAPAERSPTAIEAAQTVAEAAFAILREHFAAFRAHQEGTRRGKDPEELHQMRVASRRLRAAMGLFKEILPPGAVRLRRELGWIGAFLGHARDADVQIEQVRAWLAAAGRRERGTYQPLLKLLQEQRSQARIPMFRVLDSPRYRRFLAAYQAFVRRRPPRRSAAARQPVGAVAPDLISQRFRAVRKAGDRLGRASPPAKLHALRIKCKRLRYAVEFFADLYGEPAAAFAKRVSRLQDLLGVHQDAHVAARRLRNLSEVQGRRLPPRTLVAMGRAAERYTQQAAEARSAFPAAYRRIIGKRWKRLREAMAAPRPAATDERG